MARKSKVRSEKIFIGCRYGSVKPGMYRMVSSGRDYVEILHRGHNVFVPTAFLAPDRTIRNDEED